MNEKRIPLASSRTATEVYSAVRAEGRMPNVTHTTAGSHLRREASLQSVLRAFRLLRTLYRLPDGLRLTELSHLHGLHNGTTSRLLRSLTATGAVERDESTGRYRIDPAFWVRTSPFFRPALALIADAEKLAGRLAAAANGTAAFVVPDENRRVGVTLLVTNPSVPLRLNLSSIAPVPLHRSAGGKCYLAHVSSAELTAYAASALEPPATQAASSLRRLQKGLALARERGYALSLGEVHPAIASVAVPVQTEDGRTPGGLGLEYQTEDTEEERLRRQVGVLREASEELAGLLSFGSYRKYMQLSAPDAPIPPPEDSFNSSHSREVVRSVGRAFRLLATVWEAREGNSVAELARNRGLDRATTYRLLQSLVEEEFILRDDPSGRYFVDPLLWLRIAPLLRDSGSVEKVIAHLLESLARSARATAMLVHPDLGKRTAVCSAYALPPELRVFDPGFGGFTPLHSCAPGKCLLADWSAAEVAEYARAGLAAPTARTITSLKRLVQELEAVRREGHAFSREESFAGVGAVAMPVHDSEGRVAASLCLAFPISELDPSRAGEWLRQLEAGARALARVLT
jgi:IclR family acetate operon transcriptional repressor